MHYICITYRGVEQLVARWAHNPKVAGSSPVPATQKKPSICLAFLFSKHSYYNDSTRCTCTSGTVIEYLRTKVRKYLYFRTSVRTSVQYFIYNTSTTRTPYAL